MTDAPASEWPFASGPMAERVRAHDWSASPLGPPQNWTQGLNAVCALLLSQPQPMLVVAGDERVLIFNDAAVETDELLHPDMLGRAAHLALGAVFKDIVPLLERAFAGEILRLPHAGGARPPLFNGASLSPVRDTGGVPVAVCVTGTAEACGQMPAGLRREARARNSKAIAQRFRALVEGLPQVVWQATGEGQWTWASPQWTALTGQAGADSLGLGWLAPVHPDDRDGAMAAWRAALRCGEYRAIYRLYDVTEQRHRWFKTCAAAVHDTAGRIVEWVGTSADVDEFRRLQDRHQSLGAELQHRVRNILTVLRSVFDLTVEAGGDLEDVADHFRGRLGSIARTQLVVSQSATGFADLELLVRDELLSVGAGDSETISIEGPSVQLQSVAAESIGLALHELTFNALKFGALKVPAARLSIRWSVRREGGGDRWLEFVWAEHGVPVVPVTPARTGFGTELICEALPYRLGARTRMDFRGGGLFCTICVPLKPAAA